MSEFSDSRDSHGDYLRRTARINEEIKRVLRISSGINLTAINAMLVSRRAGEKSRGYAVVSGELRNFSRKLEVKMAETTALVSGMVGDVAFLLNQNRSQRQMVRATKISVRSMDMLGIAIERKAHAISEKVNELDDLGRRLEKQVRHSLKFCESGISLARNAKIEAVYGGEMAVTLRQVSSEVEDRMTEMLVCLEALNKEIQSWQA